MKKRIVFPLFLLLLVGGTAAAQNWQEARRQGHGRQTDAIRPARHMDLFGPGRAVRGRGGRRGPRGRAARPRHFGTARQTLPGRGYPAGQQHRHIRQGGRIHRRIRQAEYDAGSHTVSVRPSDEKLAKIGAVSGRAYVSGSELQLLFPVTKLLELAKDVSSQAASLEAASALLANYKNLYIGFSFKK